MTSEAEDAASLRELDDDLTQLDERNTRRAQLLAQMHEAYPALASAAQRTCGAMSVKQAIWGARRRRIAGKLLRPWIKTYGGKYGWPDHGSLTTLLDNNHNRPRWWIKLILIAVGASAILAGIFIAINSREMARARDWKWRLKFWQMGREVIDPLMLSGLLVAAVALLLIGAILVRWQHRRNAASFAADLDAELYRIVFGGGGVTDSLLGRLLRASER